MLRISVIPGHGVHSHRVEGRLVGPWVAELRRVAEREHFCRLDLSAMTFADQAGIGLLREFASTGVELSECNSFMAELIREESH